MPLPRSSFTFRLALEEIGQISAQLTHLTEQAKSLSSSIDDAQKVVGKKRKQLCSLARKVTDRMKVLEKLRKRANKGQCLSLLVCCSLDKLQNLYSSRIK